MSLKGTFVRQLVVRINSLVLVPFASARIGYIYELVRARKCAIA